MNLLRSTSIVRSVFYQPRKIKYSTFDDASTEILRLTFIPSSLLADGKKLAQRSEHGGGAGWTFSQSTGVLKVQHEGAHEIRIEAP